MRLASASVLALAWTVVGCDGSGLEAPSGYQFTQAAQTPVPGGPDAGGDALGEAPPADDEDPEPADPTPGFTCVSDALCAEEVGWVPPCQEAVCQPDGECALVPLEDGTGCDDEDVCTSADSCQAGECVGGPAMSCSDENPCTDDICDPVEGCVFPPNTEPCSDGKPCTSGDTCKNGVCKGKVTAECFAGPCCGSHEGPGCDDYPIAACVCSSAPACCDLDEGSWTAECAQLVVDLECGTCPDPICNDGLCSPGELCSACPEDCGKCPGCGDGLCATAAGENCFNCEEDCGPCTGDVCGDAECGESETCESCPDDCPCGPAKCGDGICVEGETCQTCPGDCGYCEGCGDLACLAGENCYNCPLDCGECAGTVCGDGQCEEGEDCLLCPKDCGECMGAVCGDGQCAPAQENCATCPGDCGPCEGSCGNGTCEITEDCGSCPADCGGPCAGPCCAPTSEPGCAAEPGIESCVCASSEYCCTDSWDQVCVVLVGYEGCGNCDGSLCGNGTCDGGEACETCPTDCGACADCGDGICNSKYESCTDCEADCGECVGFCGDGICEDGESCTGCPGDCGVCPSVCGNGACEFDETCSTCEADCGECNDAGDCCFANGSPGCSDPAVEGCVCSYDSYCCSTSWDSLCADEVEDYGCGSCSGGGPVDPGDTGNCCYANGGAGCSNPTIEACVCAADSWCCAFEWDEICAEEVTEYGCGTCF